MILVRCKDCKYAQILKTNQRCVFMCKSIEVEIPRECEFFEKDFEELSKK